MKEYTMWGPFCRGCGRLVCEAHKQSGGRDPLVVPFYHTGMGKVLPLNARGFGVGQEVEVVVGESQDLCILHSVCARACDCTLYLCMHTCALMRIPMCAHDRMQTSSSTADAHVPICRGVHAARKRSTYIYICEHILLPGMYGASSAWGCAYTQGPRVHDGVGHKRQ